MALTKADIAEQLSDAVGLKKREAKEKVELFFEEIKETLGQGEPVKVSGFGKFELRDKTSRPGRNPKNWRGNTHNCQACRDLQSESKT